MKGIIKLLRGRVPVVKSAMVFYSKNGAKKIMNYWLNKYEDAVIHICPQPDKCPEDAEKSDKFDMPDFKTWPVKETFFHRCYYRGEK